MVCDRCDGLETSATYVGWIVHSDEWTMPYRAYVFRERAHADRWRALRGPDKAVVREVRGYVSFHWRSGVQATSDLEFHDTLCKVHIDSRHEPILGEVHLA
jgi:hypothetical protein